MATRSSDFWPRQPCPFPARMDSLPLLPARALVLDAHVDQEDMTTRFSSLGALIRTSARCLRMTHLLYPDGNRSMSTPLTSNKLAQAFIRCVRYVQRKTFSREINTLSRGHAVGTRSPLRSLHPFLDPEGTIRVGGRIHRATLPYNQRHPAILPKGSHLAHLVIDRTHRAAMDGGHSLTYAYAIRTTWIIGGRAQTRAYIRRCVSSARARARPTRQLMGDLPSERVVRSRPFSRSGLDYAGPFSLKASNRRGVASSKGYLAIFVCLCTKAAHIQVVGNLTTECFLAALRRFTSRRGMPAEIWSDNATTFHGADSALRAMLREAKINHDLVADTLANDGIQWRFIPPAAPHFGGLWEAAVKSAKSHLKRVIGQRLLTYEEMSTLVA